MAARRKRTPDFDAGRVLTELAGIAFADLSEQREVRVGDKLRALELLSKYLGLGERAAEETGECGVVILPAAEMAEGEGETERTENGETDCHTSVRAGSQ